MAYTADQLANAHAIMGVAAQRAAGIGVSVSDLQILCVMVALDESTLINVDHGGGTSVGLFQQQDSWGTTAQRMNPAQATGLFINRVPDVPGYRLQIVNMKPTVAQAVQQSATTSGVNYLAQLPAATALVKAEAGNTASQPQSYTIAGITMFDPVWKKYLNTDGTYKGFPPANGATAAQRAAQLAAMQAAHIPGLRQADGTYVSILPGASDLNVGYSTATHYSQAATNADVKNSTHHLSTITFDAKHKVVAYVNEGWVTTSGNTNDDNTGGAAQGLGPFNTLFGAGWEYYLWVAAGGILLLAGVIILAKDSLPPGTASAVAKVAMI